MKIQALKLSMEAVSRDDPQQALSAGPLTQIDPETNKLTDKIIGYWIDIQAREGEKQRVKLPISTEAREAVAQIINAIANDREIRVSFTDPVFKAYAFTNNGTLCSGVTAKATSVSIVTDEGNDDTIIDP